MLKKLFYSVMLTTSLLSGQVNHSSKIDLLIAQDLKSKKLEMPKKSSDDVFVRRAFLDIVGRIPTYEESYEFRKYNDREALIDYLVKTQGYNESMFNFYADILRLQKQLGGRTSAETYITWVR